LLDGLADLTSAWQDGQNRVYVVLVLLPFLFLLFFLLLVIVIIGEGDVADLLVDQHRISQLSLAALADNRIPQQYCL
jgi:hypothetical protein